MVWVLAACSSAGDEGGNAPPGTTPPASSGGNQPAPIEGPSAALSVTVDGTGMIRSEPAGIECPGKCTASFAVGTQVKLISQPAEGWRFTSWSGSCSGASSCEISLSADGSVKGSLALIDPRWDPSVGAADCTTAWGTAGEKLSPCDKTPDNYVVVNKSKRNIAQCNAGKLVKNARIGLGFGPIGDKVQQGDGKTPEGVLYVADLLPNSDYHRAFLLSYPRKTDSARGLASGLITQEEHDQIMSQQDKCEIPNQSTGLGGAVEIHGMGSSKDWTAGCVALENTDVDRLWDTLKIGDTIVVVP